MSPGGLVAHTEGSDTAGASHRALTSCNLCHCLRLGTRLEFFITMGLSFDDKGFLVERPSFRPSILPEEITVIYGVFQRKVINNILNK